MFWLKKLTTHLILSINTNTGTIKAEGQIVNVTQEYEYKESRGFGVEIRRDINLFENHGTLEGIASGGNAEGRATIIAEGRAFHMGYYVNIMLIR